MTAARVTKWAQRFLGTAAIFLVLWQVAALAGLDSRVGVALGLYGFVMHTVFGKAYSLIPSYFDRQLALPRAPAIQYPLTVLGTVGLAADAWLGEATLGAANGLLAAVGGILWALGVAAFLAAIAWTVRDNPLGAETGTSNVNRARKRVDRVANAFVPAVLAYLAVSAYETATAETPLPTLLGGSPAGTAHLLGAGAAALLVFAVGFRLLPRFMASTPPRGAIFLVLPTGALGPLLIALGLPTAPGAPAGVPAEPLFVAGALLEAAAVAGFALVVTILFVRTDRDRVGFWGPLAGGIAGVGAVALGVWFALVGLDSALIAAHLRLNLLGFLGLTIVGVVYQFYPPNVGSFRGANDRTALVSIGLLAAGLGIEAGGLVVSGLLTSGVLAGTGEIVVLAGQVIGLLGALVYAGLLLGLFYEHGVR